MERHSNISLHYLSGAEAERYFNDIASMRINYFRDFPYLYEGSLKYEKEYLNTYFSSKNSLIIIALDNGNPVAFSSAIPLSEEMGEIKRSFIEASIDIENYLYIGEVIIQPEYRGKGLLRLFFECYESYARKLGQNNLVFMTVNRPLNHPMRPNNYRQLEPLWQHMGYHIRSDVVISLPWKQVDTHKEEQNILDVWVKNIVIFDNKS